MEYHVFKVADNVENLGPALSWIIPQIAPSYFFLNPRFSSLGRISSPRLIDYMGIYEEGDYWILTIIEANVADMPQYLFLPLEPGMPLDNLIQEFGGPAFELETTSNFFGKRQWKVFDAFANPIFHQKLCNLFLPTTGVSENHVNAYVQAQASGVGRFEFHSKSKLVKPPYLDRKYNLEYIVNGIRLEYAGYRLEIHQKLPAVPDHQFREQTTNVAGWIDYVGEQGLSLEIGILYHSISESLDK